MENNATITAFLILILALVVAILYTVLDKSKPEPVPPKPKPTPKPNQPVIGGCKGTQFGWCPDEVTPCPDKDCKC